MVSLWGEPLGYLPSWSPDWGRGVSSCSPLLRASLCHRTDPLSGRSLSISLPRSPGQKFMEGRDYDLSFSKFLWLGTDLGPRDTQKMLNGTPIRFKSRTQYFCLWSPSAFVCFLSDINPFTFPSMASPNFPCSTFYYVLFPWPRPSTHPSGSIAASVWPLLPLKPLPSSYLASHTSVLPCTVHKLSPK